MIETIRGALRREMERTGLRGKKLSRVAGLNEQAVRDLMQKVDDPKLNTLLKLASALGIPPGHLFDEFIPVSGQVGVEGIVRFEGLGKPQLVPKPPTARGDLVALKVIGDHLLPAHRDGDILFISRDRDVIELDYIGDECVAQLLDGAAYLRVLASGSEPGTHTLRTTNGGRERENVALAWAAPVLYTIRAREAQLIQGPPAPPAAPEGPSTTPEA